MKPFLSRCRYSIGSSMVMMCSERSELMRSIMAASVVDLPEPVVPVVRIKPRCSSQTVERMRGSSSSSMVRIFVGMTRRTMPTLPRCWKTLTRKRPSPATPYAMSSSAVSLNFCFWRLVIMLKAMESISSGVMRGTSLSGFRMPSTRRYGWLPTFRCKSEARLSTARRKRSSILMAMKSPGLLGASSQASMDCGRRNAERAEMVRNGQPELWDRWGCASNRRLVGEEDAVVNYAGQDTAEQGADPVDAVVGPVIARDEGGSEGASRVDGCAGEGE